jgi:Spy/CpxP family protein refolding chaperone
MRRLMLPVIALSLAAAPAVTEAQTPRAQRSAAEGHGPWLAGGNPAARVLQHRETLGLTAAQVQQLEQLQQQITQRNEPLLQQLQAVRPAGRASGAQLAPERREQMQQRMQERQAQLTPEQRERMQALREQMRAASPEQRAELRERMQAHMRELHAVTPEQREQLRQQMEQRRAERQQPTAEQRARMDALRPVMQQLHASNEQARRDVEAVLTAEQQTRLRELAPQRAGEWRERRGTPGERPGPAGRRGVALQ